uniref:RNA-binding motif, single-stranded-interacting protein 2-like n=1 Tax=Myxine glutinosa TaxID=7769 RepID=UPI00358F8FF1
MANQVEVCSLLSAVLVNHCYLMLSLLSYIHFLQTKNSTHTAMYSMRQLGSYSGSLIPPLQVHSTSWMPQQQYVMQPTGTVLSPSMDHALPMQAPTMMPLAQQMSQLSLGSSANYIPSATAIQGAYIPQYAPLPATPVPVDDSSTQQQGMPLEAAEHAQYSYQQAK